MKPLILTVDDDPEIRNALRPALVREGYLVQEAATGLEGLAAAVSRPPALILLDINMPGLEGWKTQELLSMIDETRDVPVVFLTARTHSKDVMKAKSRGMTQYVGKPYQIRTLLKKVEQNLNLAAQERTGFPVTFEQGTAGEERHWRFGSFPCFSETEATSLLRCYQALSRTGIVGAALSVENCELTMEGAKALREGITEPVSFQVVNINRARGEFQALRLLCEVFPPRLSGPFSIEYRAKGATGWVDIRGRLKMSEAELSAAFRKLLVSRRQIVVDIRGMVLDRDNLKMLANIGRFLSTNPPVFVFVTDDPDAREILEPEGLGRFKVRSAPPEEP